MDGGRTRTLRRLHAKWTMTKVIARHGLRTALFRRSDFPVQELVGPTTRDFKGRWRDAFRFAAREKTSNGVSGAMLAREVVLALHLDQARFGARELGAQALAVVQLDDRRGGRQHEVHAAVVDLVDEFDEAPRRVVGLRRELRDGK